MGELKRAVVLAGGGPAVGLSLGALKRIHEESDIHFDVWSCACIGAWVGVLWNQAKPGEEFAATDAFMRKVFRPDTHYDRFPMATVFAPNWADYISAMTTFIADPRSYRNLILPDMIMEAMADFARFAATPSEWNIGNLNSVIFNDLIAPNPIARFVSSMMYKSTLQGLSQIYYPNNRLLNQIGFDALYAEDKPYLYHNAYNLTTQRLELFSNKKSDQYQNITDASLCACSALPYIEAPVEIESMIYCEGATVDTVNFEHLLQNHPDLDEVWVSRILDVKQVRRPNNLVDALNNLVMLFASAVSADDVTQFIEDVERKKAAGLVKKSLKVLQLEVDHSIYYDWTYSNLDASTEDGYRAADRLLTAYRTGLCSHSEHRAKTLRAAA